MPPPYAAEWARLIVFLLSMRGLGADGWDPFGIVANESAHNTVKQKTYHLLLPECVMQPVDLDRQ